MKSEPCHEREPGVIARCIAGETILVPARRRAREMALLTLNEAGTFLWDRLDGATSQDDLVEAMTVHFDVEADRAERDLAVFLSELEAAGCVRRLS